VEQRFLQLSDVAEVLNISASQAYALVRNRELKGIRVGGRGQWRVEVSALEDYIAQAYRSTEDYLKEHPFGSDDEASADDAAKAGTDDDTG
jgi:excisionase family DNA binding protein